MNAQESKLSRKPPMTTRIRRPLKRETGQLRDASLLVIATEGAMTEPQYFRGCFEQNSRLVVVVLPTEDGQSAPRHVAKRLRDYMKNLDRQPSDQFWLVLDTDRFPALQLSEVATEAKKSRVALAVSCPGFELWLYLHVADPPEKMLRMNTDSIKGELRALLGSYNPSNLNPAVFKPSIHDAIRRAKRLDVHPTDRWPNQLGTRVYLLVEAILSFC